MILTFGTTARHNELLCTFFASILEKRKKNQLRAFQEQCSLVYWGERNILQDVALVDICSLKCVKNFVENIIYDLSVIQPDFLVFQNNKYLTNERETRFAGIPDLIVEVWSESNTEQEIDFRHKLYAKSGTEHWYLTQDSNIVNCWLGEKQLSEQSLTQILITQTGLEFDLRYLAIKK